VKSKRYGKEQNMAQKAAMQRAVDVLERGDIYFVYRPKVATPTVEGFEDVQRFYMILHPHGQKRYRMMVIGQKQLPEIQHGGEKYWGFVDTVSRAAEEIRNALQPETYTTKTRGERVQPAGRPAGEGVYAVVRHDTHTHLAYALELPKAPGPPQAALHIAPEGSYILSVKNPERPAPPGIGRAEEQQARFPKRLQQRFRGRRFAPVDPPDFLNYAGAELLLMGATAEVTEELEVPLEPQQETAATAEIFN
jgi:hypothetical protein